MTRAVSAIASQIDAATGGITVEGFLRVGQSLGVANLDLAGGKLLGGDITVTGHLSTDHGSSV